MYRLLVTISVKNFNLLDEFERIAAAVMADYQGVIVAAYELERVGVLGEELHLVEFPSETHFKQYRQDPRLIASASLRDSAVDSMVVNVLGAQKNYYS